MGRQPPVIATPAPTSGAIVEPAPAPKAASDKNFRIILDQRLDKEGLDVSSETLQLAQLPKQQYQQRSARDDVPQSQNSPAISHGLRSTSFPVQYKKYAVRRYMVHVCEVEQFGVAFMEDRSVPHAQYYANLIWKSESVSLCSHAANLALNDHVFLTRALFSRLLSGWLKQYQVLY